MSDALVHNPDLPELTEVIPHRPPALYAGGVTHRDDDAIEGFFIPGERFFAGRPEGASELAMPVIIEAGAQLAAYQVMRDAKVAVFPIFAEIEEARNLRPVAPGEAVDLRVEFLEPTEKRQFRGAITASVDGEAAVQANIVGRNVPAKFKGRIFQSDTEITDPGFEHKEGLMLPADHLGMAEPALQLHGITGMTGNTVHGFSLPPASEYDGHFGDPSALMGVKQLELLIQTGAYKLLSDHGRDAAPRVQELQGITFPKVVLPGSTLGLVVEFADPDESGDSVTGYGVATIDGEPTAEGEITWSLGAAA